MKHHIQKESRGRGNQGDYAKTLRAGGELPEHKDWNAQVDTEKRAKKRSHKGRRK